MIKNFKCESCGECCKNLGEGKYLPLLEWEAEEYRELARQKGIELNIKPIHFFLDKRTNLAFSLEYGMFNEPCPFLENNKCSIYEKRALVCKSFPILWTSKFVPNKVFGANCFLKCQKFDSKKNFDTNFNIGTSISGKEIENFLKEVYGDSYDYALQSNSIRKLLSDFLNGSVENKKIKLRKISKLDIDKYQVMPFLKFLVGIGSMSEEARESLIQTFSNKEAFQNFINQNDRQSNNI